MSAMADKIANLCGRCDKEYPSCGKDMDDCLANNFAKEAEGLMLLSDDMLVSTQI